MKGKISRIMLTLLLLSAFALTRNFKVARMDGTDSWPMFHHDLGHSGYSISTAPNANETAWSYTIYGYVYSSPAVVDDKVYVGSYDENVYCLDASTGTHIWNYPTNSAVVSSPAVVDGRVYVGSIDRNVYCLDALTGAKIWNYTTGDQVCSSPAVADGKVYVGSCDDKVYCLDALTGVHIWNYTTGGDVWSSPAIADGKLYVGSYDFNVYAFGSVHDIAVTNVTPYKTLVGQGYNNVTISCRINVTVTNQGHFGETFNVAAYANESSVGTMKVTLTIGVFKNITLTWNTTGFAKGNYTISAYAWPVEGETYTDNNRLIGGQVRVGTPGNVNGDGIVNMVDIYTYGIKNFMVRKCQYAWHNNHSEAGDGPGDIPAGKCADVIDDDIINYQDIYIAIIHFMETDP